jgi:hypothetical protein
VRPVWFYVALFAIIAAALFMGFGLSTARGFGAGNAALAVMCALGATAGGFAGERLRARRRHRRASRTRA